MDSGIATTPQRVSYLSPAVQKPLCLTGGEPRDYIGFTKDPKLMKLLDSNESLLFADKIKKFRAQCTWKQDRTIVITTCKIYNIKTNKVQRQICLTRLAGISKALLGSKTEFTVHVKDGHDYRYMTERRNEIIDILKFRFADIMAANLPIFGIEGDSTGKFTTLEKHFKKGLSYYPPEQFRLPCENVLKETETPGLTASGSLIGQFAAATLDGKKGEISLEDAALENLQQNVESRQARDDRTTDASTKLSDEDDDDDDDEEADSGATFTVSLEKDPTTR